MTKVIGIDPGPTPGVVALNFVDYQITEVGVAQCSAGSLMAMLNGFRVDWGRPDLLAIEEFVVGRRAGASSHSDAGKLTRSQITAILAWASINSVRAVLHRATDVKPWATDERLAAAGLITATKGMTHARDAARHALYSAVKHSNLPDPLSKRSRA